MKLRSALHIDGESRNVLLYPVANETTDHLILKLAAYLLFWKQQPTPDATLSHPALVGQDFTPDLLAVDEGGQIILWMECGKTTTHKLTKITRRYRDARVVMLTAYPHEAKQMREAVQAEGIQRLEIISFANRDFDQWKALVGEKNDIIGEATETSLNLVINDRPFVADLQKID